MVLFPLSIPRKVNTLRYASALGVICAIYLCIAIFFIFWLDRPLVQDPIANIKRADYFKFDARGIFNTIPLIIFAFMYQLNMPGIYGELKNKSYARMNIVTKRATIWALIAYVITGIFGYFIFAFNPEVLKTKNILDAPFSDNIAIVIASFT